MQPPADVWGATCEDYGISKNPVDIQQSTVEDEESNCASIPAMKQEEEAVRQPKDGVCLCRHPSRNKWSPTVWWMRRDCLAVLPWVTTERGI